MPRLARLSALSAIGVLLALGGVGAAAASPGAPDVRVAHADTDDFEIESFHSDYELIRDADGHARLQVTETIVAVFPDFDQNRGFYRDIPEYRHGVQLYTIAQSVVDENGDPVPYFTEYYEDFYSIGLGDDSFVHGRQTYVITYRQVDVVEAFADTGYDEFYWDVNGTGWAQRFGPTSMTLRVDAEVAELLTGNAECYSCDEDIVAEPQEDGSVVFTTSAESLRPYESLTFAIEFAPGTFEKGPVVIPPSDDPDCCYSDEPQPSWWDTTAPLVFGGGGGLLLTFIASTTQVADRSRRTGPSDIIVPQYTPPKNLNVMVAAYVAGYPGKAFAAQLVDLAVRGNIRLLDDAPDSRARFEAQLVHTDGLDDLETQLLRAVFNDLTPGWRVSVDAGNSGIGRRINSVYRAVDKRLKDSGLQGRPRPTVLWSILFGLSLVVVAITGLNALRALDGPFPEFAVISAGVAVWAAFGVWGRRSTVATLSSRGRAINDHLLGLKDYMQLAEEDRIRMLQSPEGAERVSVDVGLDVRDERQMVKLYERLLPYAVIYGIEGQWANVLTVKAVETQVPVLWYSGHDLSAWRLDSTIKNLRRLAPEPARPAAPAPVRSKSSSGSGWGGFGGWSSGSSSGGWRGSSGSSFSSGSRGGGFSGGGGGGGGGRGR